MLDIDLRTATASDADRIVRLLHEAFEEFRGRLDPPSGAHAETVASIQAKLATATATLAFVGDRAAGCVFMEVQDGRLYFSRLAVLPAFRRHGIGRRLIAHVEDRARQLALARVRLNVRLALVGQRAYYARLGYQDVDLGTHPGHVVPTFVTMEKAVP
jgi:predicted N-acetyltransferase YhbS